MKNTTYPCKGCTDRYVGCHSECGKYIEVKKRNIERMVTQNRDKKIDDTIYDLKYNRVKSLKHGHK